MHIVCITIFMQDSYLGSFHTNDNCTLHMYIFSGRFALQLLLHIINRTSSNFGPSFRLRNDYEYLLYTTRQLLLFVNDPFKVIFCSNRENSTPRCNNHTRNKVYFLWTQIFRKPCIYYLRRNWSIINLYKQSSDDVLLYMSSWNSFLTPVSN